MRALTVRQPWATLLTIGAKRMETRTRPLRTFGVTAIHAGLAMPCRIGEAVEFGPYTVERDRSGLLLRSDSMGWPYRLPMGAVIGTVDFFQCRSTTSLEHAPSARELSLGDHSPGRYAWSTSSPTRLVRPIRLPGRLGLWTLPDDIAAQVEEALR